MRIEDIMTSELITATMDDDLEHVRGLFTRFRFRHIPIIGDEGELVGVISDRDVLANVSPFAGTINERTADANSLKRRAHQIMTRTPQTASPTEKAERAAIIMLNQRVSALPVVEQSGRLIGIVTTRDVMRWLLNRAKIDSASDAA
ncbi:MAG: CBS domain-containing protein [Planctomycetota bacterium]